MRITVDNVEKPINEISYNDGLNYGRFDCDGIEVLSYEYSIGKGEFILLMSGCFQQCLEEIKIDDQNCNETSAFSQMGYTDINGAFDHPSALSEAIETFFDRELFRRTLDQREASAFVLNSTERVEISEGEIKIYGRCFRCK